MRPIYPYNFVPLDSKAPERSTGYPGLHRRPENSYSGKLTCTLTTLCPVVTLDQRPSSSHSLKNGQGINAFKFLRNSGKKPIFQGSSLKGMIRSVYEAITNSCMSAAATSGKSHKSRGKEIQYAYASIGNHSKTACNSPDRLCPACRLFGIAEGDKIHCQGRIAFGDATLEKGALVRDGSVFLRGLSNPKPHHYPTYAGGANRTRGSVIAGRKFYYHHKPILKFSVEAHKQKKFSIGVDEYAPAGVEFVFQVYLMGLTGDEIGDLLLAIELTEGLGHKIGIGKAIGLGSCTITVNQEISFVADSTGLYANYQTGGVFNWYALKKGSVRLPERLKMILKLNKHKEGDIKYPRWDSYTNAPIDENGFY